MYSDHPSPQQLQEIARQTLASIAQRRQYLKFFGDPRAALFDAVALFREAVRNVDPSRFSEDQFADVVATLAGVIDRLEKRLTIAHQNDVAARMVLADSIRDLREAKSWIAQGYSPDPAKRPSEEERRRVAEERAAQTLIKLFA